MLVFKYDIDCILQCQIAILKLTFAYKTYVHAITHLLIISHNKCLIQHLTLIRQISIENHVTLKYSIKILTAVR